MHCRDDRRRWIHVAAWLVFAVGLYVCCFLWSARYGSLMRGDPQHQISFYFCLNDTVNCAIGVFFWPLIQIVEARAPAEFLHNPREIGIKGLGGFSLFGALDLIAPLAVRALGAAVFACACCVVVVDSTTVIMRQFRKHRRRGFRIDVLEERPGRNAGQASCDDEEWERTHD